MLIVAGLILYRQEPKTLEAERQQPDRPSRGAPNPDPTLRVPVYVRNAFIPSGWMGDLTSIQLKQDWAAGCHSRGSCIQITYSPAGSGGKGWAGIYWQYPENNWGDQPGRDLTGATHLVFWAKGQQGGEHAEFKVGGVTGSIPIRSSLPRQREY